MKLLHVIAAYKPAYIYGGPTMSAAMLCEELAKAGISVTVYATTANGAVELPVATNLPQNIDGVTVTYFNRITKDHTHFSPALIKHLWREVKTFDAVHIHAWWNLVSLFAAMVAIARGVPVFLSPRGTLSAYSFGNRNTGAKKMIHLLAGRWLLRKSHLHTTSARETAAITKLVSPVSIAELPNFVKLDVALPLTEKPVANLLKLLFLSRIEEKKGLDILLKALKLISVPYHLTIAGDGDAAYLKQLKTLSEDSAAHITWAGFYGNDKFHLIQQHHLLVLPSHDENFGNVVIESLSAGTAVLISEQVGLADYVLKHQLGWVCKTNPQSVADAINNIGKNQLQKLNSITATAPGIVRQNFTGEALVQKYINLYQKIIRA
ncbi:hypothetical protein A0256_10455 [Mucilaginibacter sp. PAMC 26640]|nr:hypothetical protein A0256_10455 [Mucilaginibacter sp. PAMC 26640]